MLREVERVVQKLEVNLLLRSETMSRGVPCLAKTCLRKRTASPSEVTVVVVSMKRAILVRQSTMTRMESKPLDEVHGERGPGLIRDGERLEVAVSLVAN